ncbi:MAG: hypothetical protein NZ740_00440 [Kiritimatiellae bacterium]|nr:hypothetical protein [Kiritimatiellia bacterium]MDW8457557.1 hypothetical protein [Verrucomicrobiota bacterium]
MGRERAEIFFRCPACSRRLAADPPAAGSLAECPNCRSSLQIPHQSTVLNPALLRRLQALCLAVAAGAVLFALGWALARSDSDPAVPVTANFGSAVQPHTETSTPVDSERAPSSSPSPPSASAPPLVAEEIQRELAEARRTAETARLRYEDLANWILVNLRGRLLLRERHLPRLRFAAVADDYSVHPDLADFLAVNPRERELLDDLLKYGRASILSIQQQVLIATQPAPNEVSIYIPPFEKAGAELREDLYSGFRTVLGPARFERLLAVSEEELARAYDFFGSAARTIQFHLIPGESPRDSPHLLIRDAWTIPKSESRRVTEVTEEAARKIPARYAPFAAWLPHTLVPYVEH